MARPKRAKDCPDWAVDGNADWNLPAGAEVWSERFRSGLRSDQRTCPGMRRWAEPYRLPEWLREALAYGLKKLPPFLAQSWQDGVVAALQAKPECGPAMFMTELHTALQIADRGERVDALAGLSIEARNDDFRDAANRMARLGPKHAQDARTWLKHLGIDVLCNVDEQGLAKRVQDPLWWRTALRQVIRRRRESLWLALVPTQTKWCSTDGDRERQSITETAQTWAENHEFVSNLGHRMPAPTPAQTDSKRRAELLAINKGIAKLSQDSIAWLVTITLPSRFHPTSGGYKNPKFDGSTPADGLAHFQRQWTRARAAMKRQGVGRYWTMGVQPHKDETPHVHLVCYETEAGMARLQHILLKYFRDSEREEGDQHRVRIDKLGSPEDGVRYVARAILYLSRAAEHQEQTGPDDEKTKQAAEESRRTAQWAATWKIRRFRTSHSALTAWRLARKPDVLHPEHPIKVSAEGGDYATFVRAWTASQGRLIHVWALNRYGEETRRTVGLEVDARVYRRQTTWQRARKGETPSFGPRDRQLRRGGAPLPIRTVNTKCQGNNLLTIAAKTSPPRFARPPLGVKKTSGEKGRAALFENAPDFAKESVMCEENIRLLAALLGDIDPRNVSHCSTPSVRLHRRDGVGDQAETFSSRRSRTTKKEWAI